MPDHLRSAARSNIRGRRRSRHPRLRNWMMPQVSRSVVPHAPCAPPSDHRARVPPGTTPRPPIAARPQSEHRRQVIVAIRSEWSPRRSPAETGAPPGRSVLAAGQELWKVSLNGDAAEARASRPRPSYRVSDQVLARHAPGLGHRDRKPPSAAKPPELPPPTPTVGERSTSAPSSPPFSISATAGTPVRRAAPTPVGRALGRQRSTAIARSWGPRPRVETGSRLGVRAGQIGRSRCR